MNDSNKTFLIKSAISFVVITAVVIVAWKYFVTKQQITEAIDYIHSFGAWSVLVFALVYVTLVSFSFPSSVFNITAGILFSFTIALPLALACGLLASVTTFLFSRYFMHDFICQKIESSEKGKSLLSMIDKHTAKLVFILRLNPFIPAVVKNYGLGVTNIPIFTYSWATLLGQVPLATLYVYLGWLGGHSMLSDESKPEAVHWLVLGAGATVSIATLFISKYYFAKWSDSDNVMQEG